MSMVTTCLVEGVVWYFPDSTAGDVYCPQTPKASEGVEQIASGLVALAVE